MAFNFYITDKGNDAELAFLLETVVILQNQFQRDVNLKIHSERILNPILGQFHWINFPEVGTSPALANDVFVDFSESELTGDILGHLEKGRPAVLSSRCDISGQEIKKISHHLLSSTFHGSEVTTALAWATARAIDGEDYYEKAPTEFMSLIYSNEVFEWRSLVEASVSILAYWHRYQSSKVKLQLIDLSQGIDIPSVKKVAFTSEKLIISKISPSTANFIKMCKSLAPDLPLIIHGFESASVYFANTFLYGIEEYLSESDIWIMSCESDEKLAQRSWCKINSTVVPLKFHEKHLNLSSFKSGRDLLYVGRISEQKNLSSLLISVSLLSSKMREEKRKLKIYGYEDFLGVPHLRIPSQGYLEYLYRLSKKLGISDIVEFHPAVPQKEVANLLTQGTLVVPSTHSDENFGLVVYQALLQGQPVVISKWGGHKDMEKYFKGITYFKVDDTGTGPMVNPFEIRDMVLKVWASPPEIEARPWIFLPLEKMLHSPQKMRPSDLKLEIKKRIKNTFPHPVRKWPLYGKIFKNYSDPNFHTAGQEYGAIKARPKPEVKRSVISPVVSLGADEILIYDCRLGRLRLPRLKKEPKVELFQIANNKKVTLSLPEWEWLWENGYIYSEGPYEL